MATISETESLQILSLARMRSELRIPDAPLVGPPPTDPAAAAAAALAAAQAEANATAHDELLAAQIHSALAYIAEVTARGSADLNHPALKSAAVVLVRQLYDGGGEIRATAALWSLLAPFRSYRAGKSTARLDPVAGDHTRYFGWSDKRVISPAEFSFAITSSSNEALLPQRGTDGYIWFAVPEAAGYPSSLHIDNGPIDQLSVFVRQAGLVDDLNGDPHIVGVSFDIQGSLLSGQAISIGY